MPEPAPPTRVPDAACALERHLARRRDATSALLLLDGEDRWGHPDAARRAQMDREAAALTAAMREAEAALEREVAALRTVDAATLDAWVAAQEALLDAYLAELAAAPEPGRGRTEAHVARQERAAWGEVRAGARAWVDQNTFYVRAPRALYQALFGAP